MKNIKVTTASGGVYIILEASAFGPDAIIGHTKSDPKHRIFNIADDDKIEEI